MRGCVYKRKSGASWYFAVDVGKNPQTGRRKLKTKGGFRTRKDAERALATVINEVNRGTYAEPTKQTVAEFLREWLAGGRARGLRPSTLVGYEVAIEKWIVPRLGERPLAVLSPGDLNAFYSGLLDDGRIQGEGGLSPRTVRICHSLIRRALKDAVRWGRLTRNVADAADPPSTAKTKAEARKVMKTWSKDELRRFLEHCRDDRLYPAFLLGAMTGLRRGELLGLRWSDVDLEAKRVSIQRALIAPRYVMQFSDVKTDSGRRLVALDDVTVAALKAHRSAQVRERLAFGRGWGEHPLADDLVFRDELGGPCVPHIFTQRFQKASRDAGLPQIRFHDLRHGHVTYLMEAGVPLPVIAQRVGHSSVAVTGDTYSHVRPEVRDDTAALGAALVFGPAPN